MDVNKTTYQIFGGLHFEGLNSVFEGLKSLHFVFVGLKSGCNPSHKFLLLGRKKSIICLEMYCLPVIRAEEEDGRLNRRCLSFFYYP